MSWTGESVTSGIITFTDGMPSGISLVPNENSLLFITIEGPAFKQPKSPKIPNVTYVSGISQLALSASDQPVASGVITPSRTESKIMIWARIEYINDVVLSAKIINTYIRRGNQLSGPEVCGQSRVRGHSDILTDFPSSAVLIGVDSPNSTSPQVYYIWASDGLSLAPKAQRFDLVLHETT